MHTNFTPDILQFSFIISMLLNTSVISYMFKWHICCRKEMSLLIKELHFNPLIQEIFLVKKLLSAFADQTSEVEEEKQTSYGICGMRYSGCSTVAFRRTKVFFLFSPIKKNDSRYDARVVCKPCSLNQNLFCEVVSSSFN